MTSPSGMLPGGLWENDKLVRDYRFREVTGRLELALLEASRNSDNLPRVVTHLLAQVLESLGGQTATPQRTGQLCVADRQFLMRQLGVLLDGGHQWLSPHCQHCEHPFDVAIEHGKLPWRPPGETFPFATVELDSGSFRFRIPNGLDQERLAMVEEENEAVTRLIEITLQNPPERPVSFDEAELRQIDEAMLAQSPELTIQIGCQCPECGADNQVEADPYTVLQKVDSDLYEDIHLLAMHYHWSEERILDLPRERRQTYVTLIERDSR